MAEVLGNMRGSIQGSLWALILGIGGLGFASIISESDASPEAVAGASVETPEPVGEETNVAVAPVTAPAPTVEVAPRVAAVPVTVPELSPTAEQSGTQIAPLSATPIVPQAAIPQLDAPATVPSSDTAEIDTASIAPPVAPEPAPALQQEATAPTVPAETPQAEVNVAADEPVAPARPAPVATEPPDFTLDPSETEAAPLPEVIVAEVDQPTDDNRPLIENSAAEFTPFIVTEDPTAPTTPEVDGPADAQVAFAPAQPTTPTPDTAETATPEANTTTADAATPEVETAENPAPDTDTPVVAEGEVEVPPLAEPESAEPVQESTPPSSGGPVRINRPSETPSLPAGQDATVVTDEPVEEDLPALKAFAATFEQEGDAPLFAVMLVDQPDQPELSAALAALGFPPSIVVNALDANASTRMSAYRETGAEVAMQVALPTGARPADVEVAFEAAFEILPEAAMLYSDGTGVLQNSRTVTTQVMDVLAAEGRGFVTVQRGLDSSVRLAGDAGVNAAPVLRVLDDSGTDARAVTRALDQAAFRARQDGGAIVVADLTANNIETLTAWLAELDPETLRPAPVSALLLGQDAED
ncbi:MAG: divergent polysaccharide deacetylase family protein [Pseudomonadota bacterium]